MRRPLPPLPGVPLDPDLPYDDDFVERYLISPEGVDRMQIWEHLHRTAEERLALLQDFVDSIHRIVCEQSGEPTHPIR